MVLGKRKFGGNGGMRKRTSPFRKTYTARRSLGSVRSLMSRAESNFVDVASTNYSNDTTGTITLLNTVAQGASVSQRIGKKFVMTSLQIKGDVHSGTTTAVTQADNILVYDRRPTGSLPAITDVLNSANSNSFNNDDNSGRFQIVRRWHTTLAGNLTAGQITEKSIRDFDEYVKLNKVVVNKSAGTGVIGDIEQGALYFITVGNTAAGTGAATTTCGFRLRFKDV